MTINDAVSLTGNKEAITLQYAHAQRGYFKSDKEIAFSDRVDEDKMLVRKLVVCGHWYDR